MATLTRIQDTAVYGHGSSIQDKKSNAQMILNVTIDLDQEYENLQDYTIENMTREHRVVAHRYVAQYMGDNRFLRDIASRLPFFPTLSDKQCVAVLRTMVSNFRNHLKVAHKHVAWDQEGNVVLVKDETPQPSVSGSHEVEQGPSIVEPQVPEPKTSTVALQAGTYTVILPDGDYRTLQVKPVEEKPGISRVLSFLYGPDNYSDYRKFAYIKDDGSLIVWKSRYETADVEDSELRTVALAAKILLQGGEGVVLKSASCNSCGKKLTVPTSLYNGYGPTCWAKLQGA